jgi:cytochrome c biogenesis protein CcdA/thiol-disulfide isomerase/thioredoxin
MMNVFVESGLAFLEGIALIVSPCIWPVLPLVLSASIEGGKKRPFGIITGFIVSFAAFAWGARWLVSSLGLNLDIIKYISLGLLALFGVVLLSSYLSARFSALTQKFANLGANAAAGKPEGFFSGLGIGALIGLVWTPCAGPILAAVLVQIIRQTSDIESLAVLAAFGLGVGVPMLIIALTGREAMNKFGFLKTHAEAIRKGLGVLVLLTVALIASGIDPTALFAQSTLPAQQRKEGLEKALPQPYPAPNLSTGNTWINSPPLALNALKGKVVLIDFWTYSCINCIRTLPYLKSWYEKYHDKGLVIIGVHSPEFAFEKDTGNVRAAVKRFGIRYPVMQDNNLDTWVNFKNRYWPAHYLIDKKGNVVYTHFGEGAYDVTEHNIRYLLGMGANGVTEMSGEVPYAIGQTPETYLGYARTENFANADDKRRDKIADYSFPYFLGINQWGLQGPWRVEKEKIVAAGADARLRMNFTARKVYLVLGTATGKPIDLTVTLNGAPVGAKAGKDAPDGVVMVDGNRLYELIDQKELRNSLLEIRAHGLGLEAYAFTFGG